MKIIGISGISGSGKTTLIKHLDKVIDQKTTILSFDNYYKPLEQQEKDINGVVNFDLPDSMDIFQLYKDLAKLKRGDSLKFEEYTFNNIDSNKKSIIVEPSDVLLLEGLFVFHFKELFSQLDFKIFIESDLEKTFNRRLKRDIEERGLEENAIHYQWNNHLMPAYQKYILPHKSKMDLVVTNNGELDQMIENVKQELEQII